MHHLIGSMGYIFGMTILGERVYFLHLVQVEGNYKHSEETYRRSEIYSVALADVLDISDGDKLPVRREYSERGVLYSYCNAYAGKIFAVDYLGRLSVFEVHNDGRLNKETARHVMINRHISGAPLRHYAYTHFNAVSIAGDTVFLGAHGRKAYSGQYSAVFTIKSDLDPETITHTSTPFVHAHDALVVDDSFYVCDSRSGTLIRNSERVYVNKRGFMRGLSVLDGRLLVGMSLRSERRTDRNRESEGGHILTLLQDDGTTISEAPIDGAQIYNVLVLSEKDHTVSSFTSATTDSVPDVAALLGSGVTRDVATYYGDTTPPYDARMNEY